MTNDFDARMERIREATGLRTQMELAEYFGIRQSSISDAKRRRSIPDAWLVTLLRVHQINPDWVLHGHEPRFLVPSSSPVPVVPTEASTDLRGVSSATLLSALARRLGVREFCVEKGEN